MGCTDTPHYENVPFEIPDSWEWTRLEDICTKFSTGPFGSMLHKSDYMATGVPVVNPANIVKGAIHTEKIMYISSEKAQELSKYILSSNDILLARRGDLSKCAIATNDNVGWLCGTGSFVMHLCIVESVYFQYIYATQYIQDLLSEASVGATMDNLNQDAFSNILIPIPPQNEQQRIINEINHCFDLIDNINNSKRELIEYIKQTKSKVLDLAIHGKLVPQDPNDEPAIELLHRINPSFKPCDTSHYENLPEGWTVCSLSDIAKITAGGTPSRKMISYWDGGTIPWLKIADMTTSGKYVRSASEYITEEGMKNSSAKLMKKGTLLYTIFASIGEVGILDFEATCNQAIANIDLYMPEMTDYIYYYLKNLQAYMYSISKGCTQQNINQGILKSATIPLPPLSEQKRIVERIETIFAQLDTITAEL